jgi:hypothetical protein
MSTKNGIRILANMIFCMICLQSAILMGQTRCQDGYLTTPDVFNWYCKGDIYEDLRTDRLSLETLLKSTNQTCWLVYSDRDDNKLALSPGGRTKSGDQLSFMEPLAVKAVSGNWVNVYSRVLNVNGIIQSNVDRGWIQAKFLILSSYSILNEKSLPAKAMALISFSGKVEDTKSNLQEYKFYFGPLLDKQKGKSRKFVIYYVLKELEGVKLLSKADKLSGSDLELASNVAGWMSNFHITSWDHRICLEPSDGSRAKQEYGNKTIPVFPDQGLLEKFIGEGGIDQAAPGAIMRYTLSDAARQNCYIMRMPVIDNINGSSVLKKVATVGRLDNGDENRSQSSVNLAELMKRLQETKDKLENLNILFVIDATQSMSPFYKAIAHSIPTVIGKIKDSGSNNNLRVGAVFYRDYPDGELACEVEPLTANHKLITDRILSTVCGGNKDKDIPEAQYNAMIKGIKEAGFVKGHSNVIVLIGDAGNHVPDPQGKTIDEVTNLMAEYATSLIAYQVNFGTDASYSDFNSDVQKYLRNTGRRMVEGKNYNVNLNTSNIQNTYEISFTNKTTTTPLNLFMFGRFSYASHTQAMPTHILEQNIVESIFTYNRWVTSLLVDIERLVQDEDTSGERIDGKEYDLEVWRYICEKMQLSKSECEILKSKVKEFSFIGYTGNRFYSANQDCFMPVVFLSETELSSVIKTFNAINSAYSGNESESIVKSALKNALVEQTKRMLGDLDEEAILNRTLDEIWYAILAIPFDQSRRYGDLAKTKLRDIDKIDGNTFKLFMKNLESSLNKFHMDKFRDCSFELADQRYYWIKLSSFPGNE